MRVVLFGASGMIGSGALIECLDHPDVDAVLAVGRRSCGVTHAKLTELIHDDFLDFASVAAGLTGYDACLYCLGVSSAGMTEEAYDRVTYGMTVAAAEVLLSQNPGMTMCFISGASTDATEKGRVMWARIKGKAENALQRMGFGAVWLFRPGYIQPMKGVRSRTRLYNALYAVVGPAYPLLKAVVPGSVTASDDVGLALLRAAREGAPSRVLEVPDINALARAEREYLAQL